jgi:hypothetical protein
MCSLAHISSWAKLKTDKTDAYCSGQDEAFEGSAKGDGIGGEAGHKEKQEVEGEGEGKYTRHSCRLWQ